MTPRALIAAVNRARKHGRPVLLDAFCGQGGAAVGYHRAGFDVVGCDVEAQPRFPFAFIQADAFDVLANWGHIFTALHAGPPCQGYSAMNRAVRAEHPRLIAAARAALDACGRPYVIENVEGARAELRNPVTLCGTMFGLRLRRHRCFETSPILFALFPPCACRHGVVTGRLVGHRVGGKVAPGRRMPPAATEDARRGAMRCDWMSVRGARQAVPPAYTQALGALLLREALARPVAS